MKKPKRPTVTIHTSADTTPWVRIADLIYASVVSGAPEEQARAMRSLKEAGRSDREAQVLYETTASIAQKAGSHEVFTSILTGEAELPVRLSPQEIAMLSGINRRSGNSGRTWEGTSGRTWEGSGGRTWEGSSR